MLGLIEYGTSWKRRCSIPLMSIMKSVVNVMNDLKSILRRFKDLDTDNVLTTKFSGGHRIMECIFHLHRFARFFLLPYCMQVSSYE